MPELTLNNIERISHDVKKEEITFSHLADDLIDHICCAVEDEMKTGCGFEKAYRHVKGTIGKGRLKEIQEETLFAVDTKYRQMKNTMKISGIAGTVLLGFAALFKIQHWPAAGIMMTLGVLILVFAFLPSALSVLWKESKSSGKLLLFVSAFFAAMFFLTGILFKVQHWPGSGVIFTLSGISALLFFFPVLLVRNFRYVEDNTRRLVYVVACLGIMLYFAGFLFRIQHWPLATLFIITGLLIIFVAALPLYTYFSWKEENHVSAEFIFLVVGSLSIMIPSSLVNTNIQRSYDSGYYLIQGEQKKLFDYLYDNNIRLIEQHKDTSNIEAIEELHTRTLDLMSLITNIEKKMVGESEGEPGNPVDEPVQIMDTDKGPAVNYESLSRPFHNIAARDFLLPGTISRSDLESAMADYREYLSEIIPETEIHKFDVVMDPSTCLPAPVPDERKTSLMSGLHSLLLLKNSLLTAEFQALGYLIKKK